MSIEEQTTQRTDAVGYTMTRAPRDPYIMAAVSLVSFLVLRFGGWPEGMSEEQVHGAIEGLAAGGSILFTLVAALWRRRVKHGNVLR